MNEVRFFGILKSRYNADTDSKNGVILILDEHLPARKRADHCYIITHRSGWSESGSVKRFCLKNP